MDDMTYSGTPGYVDGKILSKYGLQTMSSGSVRLRMNVIHQSRAFSADKKGCCCIRIRASKKKL